MIDLTYDDLDHLTEEQLEELVQQASLAAYGLGMNAARWAGEAAKRALASRAAKKPPKPQQAPFAKLDRAKKEKIIKNKMRARTAKAAIKAGVAGGEAGASMGGAKGAALGAAATAAAAAAKQAAKNKQRLEMAKGRHDRQAEELRRRQAEEKAQLAQRKKQQAMMVSQSYEEDPMADTLTEADVAYSDQSRQMLIEALERFDRIDEFFWKGSASSKPEPKDDDDDDHDDDDDDIRAWRTAARHASKKHAQRMAKIDKWKANNNLGSMGKISARVMRGKGANHRLSDHDWAEQQRTHYQTKHDDEVTGYKQNIEHRRKLRADIRSKMIRRMGGAS